MITFSCRDCGMDCSFQVTGIHERQVSRQVIEHMHTAHGAEALPAETLMQIQSTIRKKETFSTDRPELATGPLAT